MWILFTVSGMKSQAQRNASRVISVNLCAILNPRAAPSCRRRVAEAKSARFERVDVEGWKGGGARVRASVFR